MHITITIAMFVHFCRCSYSVLHFYCKHPGYLSHILHNLSLFFPVHILFSFFFLLNLFLFSFISFSFHRLTSYHTPFGYPEARFIFPLHSYLKGGWSLIYEEQFLSSLHLYRRCLRLCWSLLTHRKL